jgi:hypothetical protein
MIPFILIQAICVAVCCRIAFVNLTAGRLGLGYACVAGVFFGSVLLGATIMREVLT